MEARREEVVPAAGRNRSFRLVVPPNPRYGKLVRERLADFAAANELPEPDVREFMTAIGEALANAFEHAQTSRKIEAACWLIGRDQLVATVVDGGVGFDAPESPPLAVGAPEPTAERGRGFAIMRHCTDQVAVRSIPGKGTAVVLMRYIRDRRPRRVTRVTPGSMAEQRQ